ncbi:MAG TPA: serine hydrolase [Gemmatimonadaceae bacterium]|nr:serine hydrolase [Gemmatimonadaceae bacterium]
MIQSARGRLAAAAFIAIVAFPAAPVTVAQQPTVSLAPVPRTIPRQLRGLDDYIERGMRAWKVPGLSIAVVKDDSVVYARGFGVRRVGTNERVDERTLFAIGSSSKAFTAAAVAMLVDEKKVKWDDPATRHLPSLELFDPYATRELTVRDLLSHRSGLARGDLVWYGSEFDRDEILRRVRYLEPSWSFRARFGYQNIMYLAAGQTVEAVAKKSWDDFVDERIFTPLGMTASSTTVRALDGVENVARPHSDSSGTVRAVPYRNIDNIAPAGSINSNAIEMAQWIRLQLGNGTYEGKKLLSAEAVKEMHEPHTIIRREGPWAMMTPDASFMSYGLGWILHDYRGKKAVQHGGNIDGMHALVGMIPSEQVGVVILTNLNPNALTTAIMNRVFDAYLGAPATDWSKQLLAAMDSLQGLQAAAQKRMETARVDGTRPSVALEKYAGTYSHDMYGDVVVARNGDGLTIRRGQSFTAPLSHWHFDTFRIQAVGGGIGMGFVSFTLDPMGQVASLSLQGIGDFKRAPAAATAASR